MTGKLSPYKLSKMISLYFQGYTQTYIANKLNIDQSTVSLHISKFESMTEQQGLQAAAKEYGVMEEVQALHSLAAELKHAKLTAEEAKAGVKILVLFQKLGVKEEDHQDVVEACIKMKSEDVIASAVKLNKLEKSTGMSCEQIVAQAASTDLHLKNVQQELQATTSKLQACKKELMDIEDKKKAATESLAVQMEKVGLDMNRLKVVEELALALKEGSVSNYDLQVYLGRQQLFNKTGIDVDTFAEILEKAKTATAPDQGKGLLEMLSQYGSLSKAIKVLQTKINSLEAGAAGLEEKVKLKAKTGDEIVQLKAEREDLKSSVVHLHSQKDMLEDIKKQVGSLTKTKTALEQDITVLQSNNAALAEEIKIKELKVSDLKDLESKRTTLLANISKAQANLDYDKSRLAVFESFLGVVGSTSSTKLEEFLTGLPVLLDLVKQGKHSPELLRAIVVRDLTGGTLQVMKCLSCGAKFSVDKSPPTLGYHCPCCGTSLQVMIDQDGIAVLKKALVGLEPTFIFVKQANEQLKPPISEDKAGP